MLGASRPSYDQAWRTQYAEIAHVGTRPAAGFGEDRAHRAVLHSPGVYSLSQWNLNIEASYV